MSAWPLAKISQLTTKVGSGATPNGGEAAYQPTGTPLIRSMNVHFSGFKRNGLAFLDDKQAKGLDNAIVKAGDVLLNITGASIGRVTWAPADLDGARVNQHVCIIRPRAGLEAKFLAHFLASPPQQRRIMNEQVGATRQGLTKGRILEFDVPVPTLSEQRRIVAKIEELFSDLDAGVAALERVRANLKRYRAAVLKAAVEGRLTEEWRKQHPATEPAAQLLERILAERRAKWERDQLRKFKESGKTPPKGWKEKYDDPFTAEPPRESKIPASWTWATFDQLCEEITVGHVGPMKDEYRVEGIPFLRSQNVRPLRFDRLGLQFIPESFDNRLCKSRLVGGELLVVRSGVNVGDACEYPMTEGRANCSDLVIARPSRFLKSGLGAIYIVSPSGQAALQLKRTGNAQPHFNIGAMRQSAVPIPPLAEQAEIVAEVERRLSVADAADAQVEHALQHAARLRQAILKRAFEGKLVPQDPADEPAAVLLDRIKASSNGRHAVIETNATPRPKATKRTSRARAWSDGDDPTPPSRPRTMVSKPSTPSVPLRTRIVRP